MGVSSLSGAVEWWDEWQLHVLTIGSLVIQYLLGFTARGRASICPSWFRFFIWLSFLGSDAIAIYALATLFNRQRYQQHHSPEHGSRDLQVFWAPILLIHLGGQVVITAYNLEDNELWRRHIVTALSQVTVVAWVLFKSWGSLLNTKRFQAAAILLFIAGILKCFDKPWALKSASFRSLANSSGPARRTANTEEELKKYVKEARDFILSDSNDWSNRTKLYAPGMLFIDFVYPYSDRLTNLKSFFIGGYGLAYRSLQDGLSDIFKVLYTRGKVFIEDDREEEEITHHGCCSGSPWIFSLFLLLPPYFLIEAHTNSDHDHHYNNIDHIVTVILLVGTAWLEPFMIKYVDCCQDSKWPPTVSQHNIIGHFARNTRHTMLIRFARFLQCKDLLEQYWSMKTCYSAFDITELVNQHVQHGWKEYIKDVESYREFNDIRGQWTLLREGCDPSLDWSLEKPFDESILLWHMATDFCFHHMDTPSPDHDDECVVLRSREISNYMMHLLFHNPEMLMAGSRSNLFKTAYNELKGILKGEENPRQDKRIAQKIVDKLKSNDNARESFIYDAWVLAERLMDLGDETKMWKVIQGVWLEMLCYSAGRCRGYLHAKSLGSGGEFLSYVWLLLAHTGMETFSERLQRTLSIQVLKEKREHLSNTSGSDQNTQSAGPTPTEGTVPFEEIVVLP